MRRLLVFGLLILTSFLSTAQLQVSKLIGKNSGDFSLGYGGFLKFAYPIIESSDITLEVSANIFQEKNDKRYGWITLPVKAGFRYTINQTGTGFYVEPQVGYNIIGVDPTDNEFKGPVAAGGVGYLFEPGIIQFDIGLIFERAFYKVQSINYVSLRLAHNFSFRRRGDDY